eukprot:CAMPEP_0203763076 /NCGR_PEP_ID=MMETSP0098-20131031/15776_1 /ASSEMBLY_ACC=CAM_ASM_000208 /TAXON_ID=96639 /ORGANISM=" , Strain NY0313808BC1" /LENGTH=498 /DNA_ID=CAMNT_0050657679 /DNA_START=796 /DNA_END=2292 /DNA_ORIENTATION=+
MESRILELVGAGSVDTLELSKSEGWDHLAVVGLLKSLTADGYALMEQKDDVVYLLTKEGRDTIEKGSPEMILLKELSEEGMDIKEVQKYHKVGMGKGMKNKWFKKDGSMIKPVVNPDNTPDTLAEQLSKLELANGAEDCLNKKDLTELKKRGQVEMIKTVHYICSKGPEWAPVRSKPESALTKEMLESGSWKEKRFKPTNYHSLGTVQNAGYLHPLMQVRTEFRKTLVGMGFEEMPTSKWVESSFWNFDSLFQPQQHPARDAHDTFFIKDPAKASLESVPKELVERVKNMHEVGGNGSEGYRYKWSLEESRKNILRTHTTAVSSQMLYKLANQEGGFKPAKYFSIDRVFRNETVDATHLAEFHQVEGLVADYNLSLGDLIGVIKTFFEEIGISDVRFKPAYNPYTEPSMEIFGYHPGLKKWTEVGNSGMFRPEMLGPLGLPKGVRVIAWGLALERPTMIKFRVKKIKSLFGNKIDLDRTRTSQLPLFKEHEHEDEEKA